MMRLRIWSLVALVVLLVSSGCCVRHAASSHTFERERIESIPREITIYDTVTYEILRERDSTVIAHCDSSYLENSVAKSSAYISPQGLVHTLESKAQQIEIPTRTVVEWRDTLIERVRTERVTIEVERKRSRLERVQIVGFWVLLLLFGLSIVLLLRN